MLLEIIYFFLTTIFIVSPVLNKTFHQSFYQKETLSEFEDATEIKGSHVSFITWIFILELSLYSWKIIKAAKSY